MTDAPTPRTRFIPCVPDPVRPDPRPREYCGALILDTDDMRRFHREWHAHEKNAKDGVRSALTARDAKIRELEARITDMQRDVENIDIPDPIDPIEIASGGWSDDDEPDLDDGPRSTYADDDLTGYADATITDATVATLPAVSGLYTPGGIA